MRFSVIIPAFNEEKYLPKTLECMVRALANTSFPSEIIVVDNQSEDKTRQIAANYGAKVISESVHNIGRVRNTGATKAAGEILVFIDADTLVPVSLFPAIVAAMQDEKCFGGSVAVDYGEFQRKWMKFYALAWRFWGNLLNMRGGAAQFCRKRIFEEVGGYDESIFVGEDVDFYWQLAKFAKRNGGFLQFIEDPMVITSTRRFDKMSFWKTLLLTHPIFILLNWKRKSAWKDWYDDAIR